jgi:hypothetical protein
MAVSLNLMTIPVVASLVAGTGAVATYVGVSSPAPPAVAGAPANALPSAQAPIATATGKPCDTQTWPYIDAKCLSRAKARPVRVVIAPRQDDGTSGDSDVARSAPGPQASVSTPDALTSPSGLTSRDTVLQRPDAAPAKDARARGKRAEGRARSSRVYQVPSESRRGSGAIIVVRPLRLDQFR